MAISMNADMKYKHTIQVYINKHAYVGQNTLVIFCGYLSDLSFKALGVCEHILTHGYCM